jgi:LPXTG-motif cell wall-anchored protein
MILAIVAMALYPPFSSETAQGVTSCGYKFITSSVSGAVDCQINSVRLLVQWAGVLIVGGIAFFLTKKKKT